MAEEKKEEAKEEGEEKKKKGLPILWIVIGLILVLGIGGAAAFFLMKGEPEKTAKVSGKDKGHADKSDEEEEGHAEEEKEEEQGEGDHGEEEEEGGEHGGADHAEEEEEEEDEGGHGGGSANCPHPPDEGGGGHGAPAKAVVTDTFPLEPFIVNLSGEGDVKFLKVTVKLKLADPECTRFVEPHVAEMRDSILMLLSSKDYEMIRTVQGKMELRDEILERVKTIVRKNRVKGAFFTDFVAQ